MSCCGGGNKTVENFNAGNPPLLQAPFPGTEFPGTCGAGGFGEYGTYGGCPTYDHYEIGSDYDAYNQVHEPACQCQACATPYSVAYAADTSACGCVGPCKCASGAAVVQPPHSTGNVVNVSADVAGHDIIDAGLSNVNGLGAYVNVPFLNVQVNLSQLLKYVLLIIIVAYLARRFLGLKLPRL